MVSTDIKQLLEEWVQKWDGLGNFALLYRFVLRNGEVMKGQALPEPYAKLEAKQCFANATRTVLFLDDSLTYCEGIAVSTRLGLPIHHAWCVNAAGEVIDQTWSHPEEALYMGVKFDREELARETVNLGSYGLLDTGTGLNVGLMVRIDPPLKEILETYIRTTRQRAPDVDEPYDGAGG